MKKTKHNPPGKKMDFIKFSKVQQGFIAEVVNRQRREFNEALGSIYEDLGIAEKILQAPPGTFVLRKDFSGLDVLPVVVPKIDEKAETETKTPPKTKTQPETKTPPETESEAKIEQTSKK